MTFPELASPRLALLPRTERNYKKEVNEGRDNSIVISAINWIMRNFPEAEIEVIARSGPHQWDAIPDHPMVSLLEMPNPEYTGVELWMASIFDYVIDGNVYWAKVKAQAGNVVELWWIPAHMIEPKGNTNRLITHYEYRPENSDKVVNIKPEDIVHLRFGLDPQNPRKGMSQVKSIFREIFTDEEAANFSGSVLANFGIPGVIISPKHFDVMMGNDDVDAETIAKVYNSKTRGDRRGEPLVLSAPTEIEIVSWNPEQLDLKMLRRVPEERVSAVLGIPATVLGLGAGLDRSTFNNYFEARESAYENNILPTYRILAAALRQKLLPDFESNIIDKRVQFDISKVRALQEDINKKYERNSVAVNGGWMKVSEARQEAGYSWDETDEVYLRDKKYIEVPMGEDGQTVDHELGRPEQDMEERIPQPQNDSEEESDE